MSPPPRLRQRSTAGAQKEPKSPESYSDPLLGEASRQLWDEYANQSPRSRHTVARRAGGGRVEHKPGNDKGTHEAIKGLLSDSDPLTRQFAKQYAGHFQDLLSDPDPATRKFALQYASHLKHCHENP